MERSISAISSTVYVGTVRKPPGCFSQEAAGIAARLCPARSVVYRMIARNAGVSVWVARNLVLQREIMAESGSRQDDLQQSRRLTALLLAEIGQVKALTGKWSIIRNKLHELPSHLADLSELPGFQQNAMCRELLQSILSSLNEARELARKCVDSEHGVGKLQMQSSLDGLAMKLSQNLQDCALLVKSGVLREWTTPSRSRTLTNRDSIRCRSRAHLAGLQIGNMESRQKALDSLLDLMQDDDKNVLVVAGQGSVPVLIHLLEAGSAEIREKAAVAVCMLAQVGSCQQVLVTEGVLTPLVRLLESGSPLAKEKASAALQALSYTPENARMLGTHCGVAALVHICRIGTPAAQAAAAGALRNLASFAEVKQNFVDEDAVPVLIRLCTSGTALAQEHAVDCLRNLGSDDDNLKAFIAREGGIHPLLVFWDGASTPRAHEIAIEALKNLSACAANSGPLISAGFIPRLARAVKSGIPAVQQIAATAIHELASSTENRKALGEGGCIPGLVKMFEAKTTAEQEAAARALSALILFEGNRKAFTKECKAVSGTVQLLDPSNLNTDKKCPISILLTLSNKRKCKKQMVAAGACFYLEKLAAMEVEGAKRLLECLHRGKPWKIFGRT